MSAEVESGSTVSIFAPQYRGLTLGVVAIMTIAAFEGMGVITAMPAAAADLDGLPLYGWGLTAFAVASLFAMAAAGGWADRRGPIPPLATGLAIFAVGLAVAGVAPDMLVLLGGRGLQGLGFGAVIVALYVVIGKAYPEDLRPRVITALSGAWVVPGIAGPLVAGVVTESIGWRWVFFGVLILMAPVSLALLARLRSLHITPDVAPDDAGGRKRLALMAAVGVGLLQYSAQRLDWVGALLAVPALALLAFSVPRLLPAGTLQLRRGLPTVIAVRGIMAGAFFGAEWFVPLLLVNERGLTANLAGGALSGAAVGWFIGSWLQGRPSNTMPRHRLIEVGCLMTTVGIATSMVVIAPETPWWIVAFTWSIGAFGMGILYGSLGVLLLEYSLPEEQGVNSAALQISDSLGVIVCAGLGGVIFATGHDAAGQDALVYLTIFAVMVLLAAVGTAASPRVRRRHA
jgi:MFS family permease